MPPSPNVGSRVPAGPVQFVLVSEASFASSPPSPGASGVVMLSVAPSEGTDASALGVTHPGPSHAGGSSLPQAKTTAPHSAAAPTAHKAPRPTLLSFHILIDAPFLDGRSAHSSWGTSGRRRCRAPDENKSFGPPPESSSARFSFEWRNVKPRAGRLDEAGGDSGSGPGGGRGGGLARLGAHPSAARMRTSTAGSSRSTCHAFTRRTRTP